MATTMQDLLHEFTDDELRAELERRKATLKKLSKQTLPEAVFLTETPCPFCCAKVVRYSFKDMSRNYYYCPNCLTDVEV